MSNPRENYNAGLEDVRNGKIPLGESKILEAIREDSRLLKINSEEPLDEKLMNISKSDENISNYPWISLRCGLTSLKQRHAKNASFAFRNAADKYYAEYGADEIYWSIRNLECLSLFESFEGDDLDRARQIVDEARLNSSSHPWLLLALASFDMIDGEGNNVFEILSEARIVFSSKKHLLHRLQWAVESVLHPHQMTALLQNASHNNSPLSLLKNFREVLGKIPETGHLHLVAADDKYFQKFSKPFLASMNRTQDPPAVHVHVVDLTAEGEALIKELVFEFPNLKLSMSTSALPNNVHKRAYFASVRFFLARHILEETQNDLIISDIDVEVIGSSRDIFSALGQRDIGVRLRPRRNYLPWKKVVVNLMVLRNATNARVFLSDATHYIYESIRGSERRSIWGVDQTAFYYSYQRSTNNGHRILDLNTTTKSYVSFAGNNKLAWAQSIMTRAPENSR
ncbi:MAG: hypothetical protein NXH74_14710 [Rhodobacteraceae bacterium]|nr:hypothetical protein [Paracoccaceae bacterium]